jgi:DNA polymerase (family 10)
MDKNQIIEHLELIATLLELKGENPFKVNAYRNAARSLETLSQPLESIIQNHTLHHIKGIGQALAEKIIALHHNQPLPLYENLINTTPPGLLEILKIPGLGPKKVKLLYEQLQIDTLDKLQQACKQDRLTSLKGFGKKTQDNILQGIDQLRRFANQFLSGSLRPIAQSLVDTLRNHPATTRISIAGSLRRWKETIKDIDLIASSSRPDELMQAFTSLPQVQRVLNHGETKSSVLLTQGIQCDLRVVADSQYPYALAHFTGSKEHNIAMRQRAIAQNCKLSEWGLFHIHTDGSETLIPCPTEEALYKALGLQYIPPELREDLGEIHAAENHSLPHLIEWTQLKGTLHCHTTESDGLSTLEELAQTAIDLGLQYLGISDHSSSQYQAHGLDPSRLLAQLHSIQLWNQQHSQTRGIQLLAGTEVDILKDGTLDFPDEILAQLDFAIASIHTALTHDEETMTRRILRAIENPYVTCIGHPTGRLLLQRSPYALNIPKILQAAAETGTWIELNATPSRLDLDWRWWHHARDLGVKCIITPDAHHKDHLHHLRLGVHIARKGWLRAQDVVNTTPWPQFQTLLKSKRSRFVSTHSS